MRSPHLKMARAAGLALAGALIFSAFAQFDRAQAEATQSESTCVTEVAHSLRSFSPVEEVARASALARWSRDVEERYGPDFSLWELAVDQRLACARKHGVSTCRAAARPCS